MKGHRHRWMLGAACVSLSLGVMTGCNPIPSATGPDTLDLLNLFSNIPEEALASQVVLGSSAEKVIIARTPPPEGVPFMAPPTGPDGMPTSTQETTVVAVDLSSLTIETVAEDLALGAHGVVSDGRWLAWVDPSARAVVVRDLGTGTDQRYFSGFDPNDYFNVATLEDNQLVLERYAAHASDSTVVLIDLLTGEQSDLGWLYAIGGPTAYRLLGDALFFLRVVEPENGPVNPMLAPDITSEIVRLDLITLESDVVATINGEFGPSALYEANGRLIWSIANYTTLTNTVQSYVPETGTVETVFEEQFDNQYDSAYVGDVGDAGVLWTRTEAVVPIGPINGTQSYELRSWDGSRTTVYSFEQGLSAVPYFASAPRFAGNYVLFRDPFNGEYILHDLETGEQRRFDPFASLAR